MFRTSLIGLLLAILLIGAAFADNRSPMDSQDMRFVFRGKTYQGEPNTSDIDLGPLEVFDYTFIVNCRFDTGGVDVAFVSTLPALCSRPSPQ